MDKQAFKRAFNNFLKKLEEQGVSNMLMERIVYTTTRISDAKKILSNHTSLSPLMDGSEYVVSKGSYRSMKISWPPTNGLVSKNIWSHTLLKIGIRDYTPFGEGDAFLFDKDGLFITIQNPIDKSKKCLLVYTW